ncbi:MAG: polyribonucleotide nucleotidyltransferase [Chloroflexi bacterium]|nr:MAG: polyribonucleotide nucleotidyltransferase [Chloroflexota bacterium]TMG42188.1 MAG: polyribonucleotide nucleotidyltransferase [Chloroflexota bacterium]
MNQTQIEIGGRTLTVEAGRVAQQASGAVTVRMGDTMLLVTATMAATPREGIDFFPLTCDYEEKLYAAGKIPGGFIRREGRPSEQAILNSRLIDRPIRPLFPKDFRNDVQVVATVLSVDQEADPATLAINGASLALSISPIPFQGPIGAVRIGLLDDQLVVNPPVNRMEESRLDLVVAGTREAIIMVEAGAKEVPEEQIVEALRIAHREIIRLCDLQEAFAREAGKPKVDVPESPKDPEIDQAVDQFLAERLDQALFNPNKALRESALDDLKKETVADLGPRFADRLPYLSKSFEAKVKQRVRGKILDEGMRPDGRKTTEIRQITCEVGVLPRTHGSALFTRGQTQALSIVTLGSIGDKQKLDGLGLEEFKRFMHHYNFPPFSVGEARPLRSPGRREIGHGALAERALLPVVPTEEEFPYTIRLVTEILSSNGSTSMASVCGSSLAMMDAGVPIKSQVAGIAMGLITGDGKVAVLSDIQGVEDALGDMDFKVAGTRTGVTAMQMDMKIKGISIDTMAGAIQQAKDGRFFIMDKMDAAISQPRSAMSQYAPRMVTIQIHPDKIREVIGPGGKMIRKIIEDSGVTSIDIEDDGRVVIGSVNGESAAKAEQIIRDLTGEVEVGKNYKGKVVRIMPFGAFVQIMPNQDGLVHISQLAEDRVERVEDAVNVGDEIDVKVTEVDRQGRVNLSRKAVLQEAKGITNGDWIVTDRDRGGPRREGSGGYRPGGDRGPRRDFDRAGGRGRDHRN